MLYQNKIYSAPLDLRAWDVDDDSGVGEHGDDDNENDDDGLDGLGEDPDPSCWGFIHLTTLCTILTFFICTVQFSYQIMYIYMYSTVFISNHVYLYVQYSFYIKSCIAVITFTAF